jgi:hypothetical protein
MTPFRRYPVLLAVLIDLVPAAFPTRTCFGILLGILLNLMASIAPRMPFLPMPIDLATVAAWQWLACGLLIARICVACRPRPRGPLADTVSTAVEMIARGALASSRQRIYRRKLIEALSRNVVDEPRRPAQ